MDPGAIVTYLFIIFYILFSVYNKLVKKTCNPPAINIRVQFSTNDVSVAQPVLTAPLPVPSLQVPPVQAVSESPIIPVVQALKLSSSPPIHPRFACGHCEFVRKPSKVYAWENETVIVRPFVLRYTLSMILKRHITSDEGLYGLLVEARKYYDTILYPLGFKKVRFVVHRAKPHARTNEKEHQHVRIVLDQQPALFDKVFSQLINKQIVDGFLNRDVIEKYRAGGSSKIPDIAPYADDAIFQIPLEETNKLLKSKSLFVAMIDKASHSVGKGSFDLFRSELYVFINMNCKKITTCTLSFGAKIPTCIL